MDKIENEIKNPALIRQLSQIKQRIEARKSQLKGAGDRIRKLRLYQDPKSVLGTSMTMRDMGTLLNMRYQNIPSMERFPNENFNGLTLEKAVEVAATFKVSLDYLLLGIDIVKVHSQNHDSNGNESLMEDIEIFKKHIRMLESENEKLKQQLNCE